MYKKRYKYHQLYSLYNSTMSICHKTIYFIGYICVILLESSFRAQRSSNVLNCPMSHLRGPALIGITQATIGANLRRAHHQLFVKFCGFVSETPNARPIFSTRTVRRGFRAFCRLFWNKRNRNMEYLEGRHKGCGSGSWLGFSKILRVTNQPKAPSNKKQVNTLGFRMQSE